jgi:hypothetical protein
LELDHGFGQPSIRDLDPLTFQADGIILAVNAPQIAVREKNGPRPSSTDQRSFLSKMRGGTGNLHIRCRLTPAHTAFQPVHTTISGTKMTIFVNSIQAFHTLGQLSPLMEEKIGRLIPAG